MPTTALRYPMRSWSHGIRQSRAAPVRQRMLCFKLFSGQERTGLSYLVEPKWEMVYVVIIRKSKSFLIELIDANQDPYPIP